MDATSTVDEYLEHYGIKGMKWGIRRTDAQLKKASGDSDDSGSSKSSSSSDSSSASNSTSVEKTGETLSTAELQAVVNRIRLEQEYKKLTATPPPKKSAAVEFAKDLIIDVGKSEVRRLVKGQTQISVERALERKGHKDLAKRIKPKKG